jgi:hypothetical protein
MADKIIFSLFIVGGIIMLSGLVSMPLLADGLNEHWISIPMFIAGSVIMLSIGPIVLWDLWLNTPAPKK